MHPNQRWFYHFSWPRAFWLLSIFIVLLPLAACSGQSNQPSANDDNAPVTVWVDPGRTSAGDIYLRTHPQDRGKVKFLTQPQGVLAQKVPLFNAAGTGWPDVYFGDPGDVALMSSSAYNYVQDLNGLVPQDIINKFAPGSLDGCRLNGHLYCLRNDIAQTMLWYDKPLMDKFGYSLPQTWDDYLALAQRVSREHPGYIIGTFGDIFGFFTFFWSSGCPLNTNMGDNQVHINTQDPKCVRAAKLVDELRTSQAFLPHSLFDPRFGKLAGEGKVLMFNAPIWYPYFIVKPNKEIPAGHLAAAELPKWDGEDKAWTGSGGGGGWEVSVHAKNKKKAVEVAIWLSTSSDYQADVQTGTFPAYSPAITDWGRSHGNDPYFATDPFPMLKDAAALIRPGWHSVRYNLNAIFGNVIVNGQDQGKTVESLLPEFQRQLANAAKNTDYKVVVNS